jgi:hypothetical protein
MRLSETQTRRLVRLGRDRSHRRCVFLERIVDSVCVIIREVIPDQTAQMNVIENDGSLLILRLIPHLMSEVREVHDDDSLWRGEHMVMGPSAVGTADPCH